MWMTRSPDLQFGHGIKHHCMGRSEAGGGMGCPLNVEIRFDSNQQVLRTMSVMKVSSQAWPAVVRGETPLRARYGSGPTLGFGEYIGIHLFFVNNLSSHT
jgi:hypothetical protein